MLADKSTIVSEQLRVGYDNTANEYYLLLTKPIRGEVISLVIFDNNDDYVVDGKINVIGTNRITFLKDSDMVLSGLLAEVKYLSE